MSHSDVVQMLLGMLVLYCASLSFNREEGQNLNAEPPWRKDGTEKQKMH